MKKSKGDASRRRDEMQRTDTKKRMGLEGKKARKVKKAEAKKQQNPKMDKEGDVLSVKLLAIVETRGSDGVEGIIGGVGRLRPDTLGNELLTGALGHPWRQEAHIWKRRILGTSPRESEAEGGRNARISSHNLSTKTERGNGSIERTAKAPKRKRKKSRGSDLGGRAEGLREERATGGQITWGSRT